MSETSGPDYVMLPSAENQIQLMYERVAEQYFPGEEDFEYIVSGQERLDEVLDLLSGRTGSIESRHYEGNDFEVLDESEGSDLGNYLQDMLYTVAPDTGAGKVVESVGSFEKELEDGNLASGYVLTGREVFPGEDLPNPMMVEAVLFSDPEIDSWVTVKTQEPSTL